MHLLFCFDSPLSHTGPSLSIMSSLTTSVFLVLGILLFFSVSYLLSSFTSLFSLSCLHMSNPFQSTALPLSSTPITSPPNVLGCLATLSSTIRQLTSRELLHLLSLYVPVFSEVSTDLAFCISTLDAKPAHHCLDNTYFISLSTCTLIKLVLCS